MSNLLKVDGFAGIVKDTRNGAVLSNDRDAFLLFKSKKLKAAKDAARILELETKLERMESTINSILAKL